MSVSRLVAKNFLILLITRGIVICISLIVISKTSHYLGVEKFGEYNLVFTYLAFFTLFTDLGMSTIVIREMSANREKAGVILFNYILIRTILIAISISSLLLSIPFISYPDSTKKLIMLASLGPILGILTPYETAFHVSLKFKYSIITILIRILSASLILLLIFFGAAVKELVIVSLIENITNSILAFYFGKRLIKAVFNVDFSICRFIIKNSWPLAISTITLMIYLRLDQLLIAHFSGNIAVGYYTASFKLTEQLNLIPVYTAMVLFPLLSQIRGDSLDRFIRISNLSFKYMAMLGILLGVILSTLSATLIILIYGKEFLPAQSPFKWLLWAQMLRFPNIILGMLINIMNRQKIGMLNGIFCAIISIGMNIYLIPLFGMTGAAITSFLSELTMFFLAVRVVKQDLTDFTLSPLFGFLAAGISGWLVISSMGNRLSVIFILFPLIYFGIVMLLKGFDREDYRIFKEFVMLKRKAVYVS
ncbi:MAG: flippase [Nitrospinae bacterium]|nr:flippase [Nitrospinota bacterium]MBI3813149.1 flippase [Nitrospinota bacterium]